MNLHINKCQDKNIVIGEVIIYCLLSSMSRVSKIIRAKSMHALDCYGIGITCINIGSAEIHFVFLFRSEKISSFRYKNELQLIVIHELLYI